MTARGRVMLLLVVIFTAGYILISLRGMNPAAPASAELRPLPVVVIDPGHGGLDGGAVGKNGTVEKDVNLAISLVLRDILVVSGFEVVMTRDSDASIHDDGIKGTKKQKTSDMKNRLEIVNSTPGAIFISIHQNTYGSSKSNGAQMFYGKNNPESKMLAEVLQQRFVANLQPDNKRVIKQAGKNLYLMYNTECPSVLIECGFLSNSGDEERLSDYDYQSKTAFTIASALFEFLGLEQRLTSAA